MKRLILLLTATIFITSCGNDDSEAKETPATEESTTAATTPAAEEAAKAPANSSSTSSVDSAKALLMEAQKYMELGILGKMAPAEANEKLKPIMAKFFEVYSRLRPGDTAVVYQFRMQQFQKMVDLQVAVQQKQKK